MRFRSPPSHHKTLSMVEHASNLLNKEDETLKIQLVHLNLIKKVNAKVDSAKMARFRAFVSPTRLHKKLTDGITDARANLNITGTNLISGRPRTLKPLESLPKSIDIIDMMGEMSCDFSETKKTLLPR